MQKLIVVSGNIATGKTTLVTALGRVMDWPYEIEPVSSNPYLNDFYGDMAGWAFPTQLWFLLDRVSQQERIMKNGSSAILERSILEDRYVFAETLLNRGYLTERDYRTYLRVFDAVTRGLKNPDLVLYLHASPTVLFERVHSRGRQIEHTVTPEYLNLIGNAYSNWIRSLTTIRTLRINTEGHDFREGKEVDWLAAKIKSVL